MSIKIILPLANQGQTRVWNYFFYPVTKLFKKCLWW